MSRLLQLHSTKERMDENRTAYRQSFVVGLHGHLMRDVGAGAVSSHHQVGEVSVLHQLGGNPLEGSLGVVVGSGEGVF
ncbi:hypothetical protein AAC387_Pa07g3753 [Persea americana]